MRDTIESKIETEWGGKNGVMSHEEWHEERVEVVLSALLWSSSRVWLTSNFPLVVDILRYEVNHYAKA